MALMVLCSGPHLTESLGVFAWMWRSPRSSSGACDGFPDHCFSAPLPHPQRMPAYAPMWSGGWRGGIRVLVPSVLLCHHPALTHTCVHGPHSRAHTCAHTLPKGKFKTTFPALYSEWDSSFRWGGTHYGWTRDQAAAGIGSGCVVGGELGRPFCKHVAPVAWSQRQRAGPPVLPHYSPSLRPKNQT